MNAINPWFLLFLSICFEVLGTLCMKLSNGLTVLLPSIATFVFYAFSLTGLTFVLKKLEVGIVYAVWAGLGIVLVTIAGIIWFKESTEWLKLLSIMLIVIGVIGLNLVSK